MIFNLDVVLAAGRKNLRQCQQVQCWQAAVPCRRLAYACTSFGSKSEDIVCRRILALQNILRDSPNSYYRTRLDAQHANFRSNQQRLTSTSHTAHDMCNTKISHVHASKWCCRTPDKKFMVIMMQDARRETAKKLAQTILVPERDRAG